MVRELTAADAREIALQGSEVLNKHLEDVFELVRQEAKRGGFRLRYLADGTIDIIHSLRERLSALGYAVESHAADKVDFVIYWK